MISVGIFAEIETAGLRVFATWWDAQHKATPDKFPLAMDEGEWWEQYMMWCDTCDAKPLNLNKPIGSCPVCGADWYADVGYCGGCAT